MQISELKTAAKEGREGCYLFCGEEDYLKRFYAAKIREALLADSPYALFNHVIFTPCFKIIFYNDTFFDFILIPFYIFRVIKFMVLI